MAWYQKTWIRATGVLAVLSLIVGGIGNVDTLFNWVQAPFKPDPDDVTIRSLRAGVTHDSFRATMGKDPELVSIAGGLERSIFVLETAYVAAFADDGKVVALGVIAKNGEEVGPIRFLNQEIHLGEDTIGEIMDNPFSSKFTAACGARHAFYYEATAGTPGAMNYRNISAGVTLASTTRSSWSPDLRIACTESAVLAAYDDFDPIEDRESYFSEVGDLRSTTIADSVFITSPGTEITHEMVMLHPDELSVVDEWVNE